MTAHKEVKSAAVECTQVSAIASIVQEQLAIKNEQAEHSRELGDLKLTTDKTFLLVNAINVKLTKLFESEDGKRPALLPEIQSRLDTLEKHHPVIEKIPTIEVRVSALEGGMIPHDKMVSLVRDYEIAKMFIRYIALVAALGAVGAWFWHLFTSAPTASQMLQPKVTP